MRAAPGAPVVGDHELEQEPPVPRHRVRDLVAVVAPTAGEDLLEEQAHADPLAGVGEVVPAGARHGEAGLRVDRHQRSGGRAGPVRRPLVVEDVADPPPDDLRQRRVPLQRHAAAPSVALELDVPLALVRRAEPDVAAWPPPAPRRRRMRTPGCPGATDRRAPDLRAELRDVDERRMGGEERLGGRVPGELPRELVARPRSQLDDGLPAERVRRACGVGGMQDDVPAHVGAADGRLARLDRVRPQRRPPRAQASTGPPPSIGCATTHASLPPVHTWASTAR